MVSESGRYAVISADGHAGADIGDYRPYLEARWHDEFDRWAAGFVNPYGDRLLSERPSCNWESDERLKMLEADGIVAEVIFPNTVPPFYPRTQFFVPPPPTTRDEYERRWAGLRAHNRWMADFCAAAPGRRAGVAQIMLNDVDDAVAETRWSKEAGLFGGVLLPGVPPGSELPSLYSPVYEPIWAVCEELDIPVNHHAGGGIPHYDDDDIGRTMMHTEIAWFAHRALWHLIYAGVFERHPRLKFILTEVSAGWAPGTVAGLDATTERYRMQGSSANFFGGTTVAKLSMNPSDYFRRNCWLGASFLHRDDAERRHAIGVDKIMWGSDFPHVEGSYPFSREALRATFAGMPADEVRMMVTENAAAVYGFDVPALSAVAEGFAPTVDEIATPLDDFPDSWCNAFARRPTYATD